MSETHNFVRNQDTAAQARKRRRSIMKSRRTANTTKSQSHSIDAPLSCSAEELLTTASEPNLIPGNEDSRSHDDTSIIAPDIHTSSGVTPEIIHTQRVANKKSRKQMRYDPVLPMSKDEVSAWRRDLRRVRNRQSAALSRLKIRNRIYELEGEVEDWKTKHAAALESLRRMEARVEKLEGREQMKDGDGYGINNYKYGSGDAVFHVSPCSSPPPRAYKRDAISPTPLPFSDCVDSSRKRETSLGSKSETSFGSKSETSVDDKDLREFLLEAFDERENTS